MNFSSVKLEDLAATKARRVVLSVGLFAALLIVYVASPVRTSYDSAWTVHTAVSFWRGHAGFLTEYPALLASAKYFAIEYCRGLPRSMFPIGASLLALPGAAIAALANADFIADLQHRIPVETEQRTAAFYGALAGVLFFWLIFHRFRSVTVALAATFVFAFCTPMWSTATRALWQHGPMVLMLVIAMLLLVHASRRPALAQFASLPLAFAFVVRPTAAIPIVVLGAYVLVRHRPWFLRFALWGLAVALPWLVFNFATCDALLPIYYRSGRLGGATFLEALLGNLASPARGLFVYSPVLLLALSGFVLAMREREDRALHAAFGAIVVLHVVVVSTFPHWWLGFSFGPRAMTDALPFLCYFVADNFRLAATLGARTRAAVIGLFVLLAGASAVIHAQGALRQGPQQWNASPVSIDEAPWRLWDWRDPQFAR